MSMMQEFIEMETSVFDSQSVSEISKEEFDNVVKKDWFISAYENEVLIENGMHPLQKVYVHEDNQSSYPSGSTEWEFVAFFKYKGKYYCFSDCGGN